MPDYDFIRTELLRNGVNKKLLWTEYLDDFGLMSLDLDKCTNLLN